jgi:hypothetical protein
VSKSGLAGRYPAAYANLSTGEDEPAVTFEPRDGRQPLVGPTEPVLRGDAPTWEDWLLVVRPAGTGSVGSVSAGP